MKTRVLLMLTLLLAASTAFADQCVQGSLASYIALGSTGCTIGDKTFYGFGYSGATTGGATDPGTGGITVNPINANTLDPGVLFTGLWTANSDQTLDSFISFFVKVGTNGSPALIKDSSLAILGSGFSGTGVVGVDETLCLDGSGFICTGNTTILNVENSGDTVQLVDTVLFSLTGSVFATKDIHVAGGDDGRATLSGIADTFSQIPEPASMVLFGTGLLGLAGAVRRKLGV